MRTERGESTQPREYHEPTPLCSVAESVAETSSLLPKDILSAIFRSIILLYKKHTLGLAFREIIILSLRLAIFSSLLSLFASLFCRKYERKQAQAIKNERETKRKCRKNISPRGHDIFFTSYNSRGNFVCC